MTASHRTRWYLVGWTLFTATCVSAVAALALVRPEVLCCADRPIRSASGAEVVIAELLGWGFAAVGAGAVLAVPGLLAVARFRDEDFDDVATAVWLLSGLVAVPGVLLASVVRSDVARPLAVGLAVVVALFAGYRTYTDSAVSVREVAPWSYAHVGLFVALVVAWIVLGSVVGLGFAGTVETDGYPYTVNFEASYDAVDDGQGVVTIRHAGGVWFDPDDVVVTGTGFANVSTASQTAPGTWQGTVDGPPPTVKRGDSVTVGVERDCRLRVLDARATENRTMGVVNCSELRT